MSQNNNFKKGDVFYFNYGTKVFQIKSVYEGFFFYEAYFSVDPDSFNKKYIPIANKIDCLDKHIVPTTLPKQKFKLKERIYYHTSRGHRVDGTVIAISVSVSVANEVFNSYYIQKDNEDHATRTFIRENKLFKKIDVAKLWRESLNE